MTDAPGVHELNKYLAAFRMHRRSGFFPTFHLKIVEDAGNTAVTKTVRGRGCPFGDDKSCGSTLPIEFSY